MKWASLRNKSICSLLKLHTIVTIREKRFHSDDSWDMSDGSTISPDCNYLLYKIILKNLAARLVGKVSYKAY
jgi:hypothetical protein